MSEAYPHLIFDNFQSSIGDRLKNILKYLFPVPKVWFHCRSCRSFVCGVLIRFVRLCVFRMIRGEC